MHGERNSRCVKTPFIGVLGISNLQSPLLQRVLWLGQWPVSVFQKFQFAYSFYGYGRFVCMCVYASHACLVPCRGQKSVLDPLRLKLQISRHANAENWTQVLLKGGLCSWPLSHRSSPVLLSVPRFLSLMSKRGFSEVLVVRIHFH